MKYFLITGLIIILIISGCTKTPMDSNVKPDMNAISSFAKANNSKCPENDSLCYLIKDVPNKAWLGGQKHMPLVFRVTDELDLFPETNGKYFSTEYIRTKAQELWIKAWARRWKVEDCILWLPACPIYN